MTTLTILPNGPQEPLVTILTAIRVNRLLERTVRALAAGFKQ
jgi:hypothetical protein